MAGSQSYLVLGLIVLLTSIVTIKSRPDISITQAESNLPKPALLDDSTLKQATEDSKNNTDLGVSVGLEDNTKDPFADELRSRHWFLETFWNIQNITYKILSYPKYLKKTDVDGEIARAFFIWSEYTNLTFTPKDAGEVDIKIEFLTKDHGDDIRFDGRSGILGHASIPKDGAYVHFDNDEYWTINSIKPFDIKNYLSDNSTTGLDLFQNAVHEFGHVLGLHHSFSKVSVMSEVYKGYELNFKLSDLDIEAIQYLYGSKLSPNIDGPFGDFGLSRYNKTFQDLLPNFVDNLCNIDAIFNSANNEIFVFDGERYFKVDRYSVSKVSPKLISDTWPGLPDNLDAAFEYKDGKTYFFKGTKYWRYNGSKIDDGFPKKINESFPGVPDHLDTAIAWDDSGKMYFFKGSKFWSFDPTMQPPVKSSYIRRYSNWKGLPVNLDAAFVDFNGYTYFFKNKNYYKIDANKNAVVQKFKNLDLAAFSLKSYCPGSMEAELENKFDIQHSNDTTAATETASNV